MFRGKRADRLKLLVLDGTGMVLATKWLEERRFTWPPIRGGVDRLTPTQLTMLLEGLASGCGSPSSRRNDRRVGWNGRILLETKAVACIFCLWRFAPKISLPILPRWPRSSLAFDGENDSFGEQMRR